ncbi:MAG: stalk domain-containing protein [Oscillospiraceae bacterium]|nr:stalk domain-containing protein [Oscillospiraceae bacterium]
MTGKSKTKRKLEKTLALALALAVMLPLFAGFAAVSAAEPLQLLYEGQGEAIFILDDWYITKITTHHWNDGRGAPVGVVGIYNLGTGELLLDGLVTTGGQQHGSTGNYMFWETWVNAKLPAGAYSIMDMGEGWVDSKGNKTQTEIWGTIIGDAPQESAPSAQQPQTSAPPPQQENPAQNSKNKITMILGDRYMYVDGEKKEIDPGRGTIAEIIDDRTMIPIRAVAEEIGGTVDWEAASQTVVIKIGTKEIRMTIGSKTLTVNGSTILMDTAPRIKNDRTLVPARFAAEQMGAVVDWDPNLRMVTISYTKSETPAAPSTPVPPPLGGNMLASAYISADNAKISEPGGVSVNFADTALEEKPALATIEAIQNPPAINGGQLKAYDIKLEGQTQLRGVAEIRIPLAAGRNEIPCAGYYNQAAGKWEPVAAVYDRATGSVVIYATHLSPYGAFTITDPEQAMAMLAFTAPDEQKLINDAIDKVDKNLAALAALQPYEKNSSNPPPATLVRTGIDSLGLYVEGLDATSHVVGLLLDFKWMDSLSAVAPSFAQKAIEQSTVLGFQVDLTDIGLFMTMASLTIAANNGGFSRADRQQALLALPDWVLPKLFGLFGGGPVTATLNLIYFGAKAAIKVLVGTTLSANENRWKELAEIYYYNSGLGFRSVPQWCDILAPIMENAKNQQQRDEEILRELDKYFDLFWSGNNVTNTIAEAHKLSWGMAGEAGSWGDYSEVRSKVSKKLRDEFIEKRLPAIENHCRKNMEAKLIQKKNAAIDDLVRKLNRRITLTLKDNSQTYNNLEFRLETFEGKTSDTWKDIVKGPETDFTFTFAGFVTSDMPNYLRIYGAGGQKVLDIPFTVGKGSTIEIELTSSNWQFEPAKITDAKFNAPVSAKLTGTGLGENVKEVKVVFADSEGAVYSTKTAPVKDGHAEMEFEYIFEPPYDFGYGQGNTAFKYVVVATITDNASGTPLGKVSLEVNLDTVTVKITGGSEEGWTSILVVNGEAQLALGSAVSKAGNYRCEWDFGDGTKQTANSGAAVGHTYKNVKSGDNFIVWVTLYNADGGEELSSATMIVYIHEDDSLECTCNSSGSSTNPFEVCPVHGINVTVTVQP